MKKRTFHPGTTYRLVEFRQPYTRYIESLINCKIEFLYLVNALQDPEGFLEWHTSVPSFKILSGKFKEENRWGLPACRILTVRQRSLRLCKCPAYSYPHRPGSGACPHA